MPRIPTAPNPPAELGRAENVHAFLSMLDDYLSSVMRSDIVLTDDDEMALDEVRGRIGQVLGRLERSAPRRADLRSETIRLAASLPAGSAERRKLLAVLRESDR